jgi:hypothetical protein
MMSLVAASYSLFVAYGERSDSTTEGLTCATNGTRGHVIATVRCADSGGRLVFSPSHATAVGVLSPPMGQPPRG